MSQHIASKTLSRLMAPLMLAMTVNVSCLPMALAQVNQVIDGRVINSGTYYNTPDGRTVFQNNGSGGLYLPNGSIVRGIESDAARNATGNGGTIYLNAPGNVIRLDGNINVNAFLNGGNGGKVFANSAYLYQSGKIFANGLGSGGGGLVQFNVGSFTMAPGGEIQAMGGNAGGPGGKVNIIASGVVDIKNGAQINTSGHYNGGLDTNFINIEGSAVNMNGILKANGVVAKFQDARAVSAVGEGSRGGTIRLVAHKGADNVDCVECALNAGSKRDPGDTAPATVNPDLTIGEGEGTTDVLGDLQAIVNTDNGNVHIGPSGKVLANGTGRRGVVFGDDFEDEGEEPVRQEFTVHGGNGGTILINAYNQVINNGTIRANGGRGSDLVIETEEQPQQKGFFPFAADGGDGGTIAITALGQYHTSEFDIINTGKIQANGGRGGGVFGSLSNGNDTRSELSPGNGGQGGLIAFGYNNGMWNGPSIERQGRASGGGLIQANGGRGGSSSDATSTAVDIALNLDGNNANASATANGLNGGNGGDGGLIVFSGANNPVGKGTVQANGGNGGDGGNATASAIATAKKNAHAVARAFGGEGGEGGRAGTIVIPDPMSPEGQSYSSQGGASGHSGSAQASASASATNSRGINTFARANTNGNVVTDSGNKSSSAANNTDAGQAGVDGADNALRRTRNNELLAHAENLILLSKGGNSTSLTDRLFSAYARTVDNPHDSDDAQEEIFGNLYSGHVKNFVVYNSTGRTLRLDLTEVPSFLIENLNTLTVLNSGNLINDQIWSIGRNYTHAEYPGYTFGGAHNSMLAGGFLLNQGLLETNGILSGGSHYLSSGSAVVNLGAIYTQVGGNNEFQLDSFVPSSIFSAQHGGSINVNAQHILNGPTFLPFEFGSGQMVTASNVLQGGSISLLADGSIVNLGDIRANAQIERTFIPVGYDTLVSGGNINIKANDLALNFGTIQANGNAYAPDPIPDMEESPRILAAPFTGQGGYIRMHGGLVAANVDLTLLPFTPEIQGLVDSNADTIRNFLPGLMEANGGTAGGRILLTAGGNTAVPSPVTFPDFVSNLFAPGFPLVNGFSITQNTPPLTLLNTQIDLSILQSAYNFGHMNAQATRTVGGDGQIYLAGNNQVGIGPNSSFNGVTIDYDGILASADPNAALQALGAQISANGGQVFLVAGTDAQGRTAVEQVACDAGPNGSGLGLAAAFTPNFTLTGGQGPTVTNPLFNFDLLGLFQERRVVFNVPRQRPIPGLILGFQNPTMFLARVYAPVTDRIMQLALSNITRELNEGKTLPQALEATKSFLAEAGVDQEVATLLLSRIEEGKLAVDGKIVDLLKQIAAGGNNEAEPGSTPGKPGKSTI